MHGDSDGHGQGLLRGHLQMHVQGDSCGDSRMDKQGDLHRDGWRDSRLDMERNMRNDSHRDSEGVLHLDSRGKTGTVPRVPALCGTVPVFVFARDSQSGSDRDLQRDRGGEFHGDLRSVFHDPFAGRSEERGAVSEERTRKSKAGITLGDGESR